MKRAVWAVLAGACVFATSVAYAESFDPTYCGTRYPKRAQPGTPPAMFHNTVLNRDYWPMFCRTAGTRAVSGVSFTQVMNITQSNGFGVLETYLFRKAPRAAGAHGELLEPGECAFPDRPLNDREPAKIVNYTQMSAQQITFVTLPPLVNGQPPRETIRMQTDWEQHALRDGTFYIYANHVDGSAEFATTAICDLVAGRVNPIWMDTY